MNRNGYTTSWREEERLQTLDLPLGIDPWDPAYQLNPEAYERDIERMNRAEGRYNRHGLCYREPKKPLDTHHKIQHTNTMTKKQFEAVAKILGKRLAQKTKSPIGEYEAIETIAMDFVHYFSDQNPRFDADRFLEAVYTNK